MLKEETTKFMKDNGADLVGFSDLRSIKDDELKTGICVAVAVNRDIINGIKDGPNVEYFNEYNRINDILDSLVTKGAEFLKSKGYKAYANTRSITKYGQDLLTKLPHKTVATRAGLGWIGKSALLITKKYGSAVRISTILTNAPIKCDNPIDNSYCGNCTKCKDNCPAGAILGNHWNVYSKREELVDAFACEKKADELCMKNFDITTSICGKCIEVCPFTIKYLNSI